MLRQADDNAQRVARGLPPNPINLQRLLESESKTTRDEAVIVRRMLAGSTAQVAGFRYFNVYGPREQHKGRMASVAYQIGRASCRERVSSPV